jgi:hypothetical protein
VSKLQALAASYRLMPYGGAILSIHKLPSGSWAVADGMTLKASFLLERQARASLRVAGFTEIRPNQFKLAQ